MAIPSEWRTDPLTGRRVLIAPARGERPSSTNGQCPFCEGNEAETTKEVLAVRQPDSVPNESGWRVRVIPNRYAAVWWYDDNRPDLAHGVAELFIEGPKHNNRFELLETKTIVESITCWRERLRTWQRDGRLAFVQVFKNQGPFAGASVDHCHSQLIGVQIVPDNVVRECDLVRTHFIRHGTCLTCSWLREERHSPRFVAETEQLLCLSPKAARFPGELWLIPKRHEPHFHTSTDDELQELASLMRSLLQQQAELFAATNYNIVVKSSPFRPETPEYHWRIELLPRTTGVAGWEWGTGVLINTMTPEDAAARLRPRWQ